MKILVCGGRDFADPIPYDHSPENKKAMDEYRFVQRILDALSCEFSEQYSSTDNWLPTDICIIHGCARGADTAAQDWVVVNWCSEMAFPADWKKFGKKAGFLRNKQMLDEGKPDLVVAFPGGKGTAMMVKLAKEAGVEVREIKYDNPHHD